MLKKLTQFYYPKTVEDACSQLANAKEKISVLAGGTSEALRNDSTIEALVDLSKIKELSFIKSDSSSISIGAATPVQDIYKSDLSGVSGELLKTAAGKIGSTLLRNAITAGGNLVALFPWSDLPAAYMVLDAEVVCRKGKPKRTVPVINLINSKPASFLTKGEIVAEIKVPVFKKGTGASFAKMSKTSNDYSLITVASRITIAGGKIEEARLAVNAITAQPVRCEEAEKLLVGKKPDAELLAEAAKKAVAGLKVRKDYRATEEYRKEVCEVMIRRSLEESIAKAAK